MDGEDLPTFIAEAIEQGSASGRSPDGNEAGGQLFRYASGRYRSEERAFGNNPFLGLLIVYEGDVPIWGFNYYAVCLRKEDRDRVLDFDRRAIGKVEANVPSRGPNGYTNRGMEYRTWFGGDLDRFVGVEKITEGTKELYRLNYVAGTLRPLPPSEAESAST